MPNTLATPIETTGLPKASVIDDARLSSLIDALHRDGIQVSVTREVHEWVAATATVTSHLTCIVDGCPAEGVGVARDRVSASVLAIRSVTSRSATGENWHEILRLRTLSAIVALEVPAG